MEWANVGLREKIVEMVVRSGEGHIPSSFSIIDILEVLYRDVLRLEPATIESPDRDFFILSKGHGAAALFSVLHEFGFISSEDLSNYGLPGAILGGHPDSSKVPAVEASTGSLGHGLPFAVGVALGQKISAAPSRVFALVGDGECQEGTVWESAHVAANRGLGNLCVIVDWNRSGAQLTPIDNLPAKWSAFGWDVVEVDGHDKTELRQIFDEFVTTRGRDQPLAVIAHTIKGKGVSFTEGHGRWHHRVPDSREYEAIMGELS